jgi:hypothetical protein
MLVVSLTQCQKPTQRPKLRLMMSSKAKRLLARFRVKWRMFRRGGSLFRRQKQLEVVNLISSQEDASNQLSSGIAAFVEKTATMKKVCTPSSPRAPWRILKFDPLWGFKNDFCKFLK